MVLKFCFPDRLPCHLIHLVASLCCKEKLSISSKSDTVKYGQFLRMHHSGELYNKAGQLTAWKRIEEKLWQASMSSKEEGEHGPLFIPSHLRRTSFKFLLALLVFTLWPVNINCMSCLSSIRMYHIPHPQQALSLYVTSHFSGWIVTLTWQHPTVQCLACLSLCPFLKIWPTYKECQLEQNKSVLFCPLTDWLWLERPTCTSCVHAGHVPVPDVGFLSMGRNSPQVHCPDPYSKWRSPQWGRVMFTLL